MQEINILVAFGAGLATFFAPCTFAALPAFLTYLAGETSNRKSKKTQLIKGLVAYLVGFLSVFTLLGLVATGLGNFLLVNKVLYKAIGGIAMILIGLFMLIGHKVNILRFLYKEKKIDVDLDKPSSPFLPLIIGVTNAFAWTPCIGPILGVILVLASTSGSILEGGLYLFMYGLGTTIPFILLAVFFSYFKDKIPQYRKLSNFVYTLSSILIIILGMAFVLNLDQNLFGELYRFFERLGYKPA